VTTTEPLDPETPTSDDVMVPEDDVPPSHWPRVHGGMPLKPDDDALALAVERDRVAAGVADYAPDGVPPATDPLPTGSSPTADLAQRGLLDDETA
jgi:hypothetical protein